MIQFKCCAFTALKLEELYAVLKMRHEVFVIEQDCIYLDMDGNDQSSYHLMGFSEQDDLVAYARLIPKGISYKKYSSIGRVVTTVKCRNQGLGKLLMQNAINEMEKLFGRIPIKISAQCHLVKFYQNLGFLSIGASYLEDDIPHIGMIYTWNLAN